MMRKTVAQIQADARAPYADAILAITKREQAYRAALEAIVKITDGSQPIDYPGALMVARSALMVQA
jgi:hypothetical protein